MSAVLAPALLASLSSAATSAPNAGDWAGKVVASKSSSALTFTVSASGRKRVVSNFQSAGNFLGPCTLRRDLARGILSATVNAAGKCKGHDTWNARAS
jgi:hypothetical protein